MKILLSSLILAVALSSIGISAQFDCQKYIPPQIEVTGKLVVKKGPDRDPEFMLELVKPICINTSTTVFPSAVVSKIALVPHGPVAFNKTKSLSGNQVMVRGVIYYGTQSETYSLQIIEIKR